ncbi:5213_t:CDS:2, partial [Gigaspora margarita]
LTKMLPKQLDYANWSSVCEILLKYDWLTIKISIKSIVKEKTGRRNKKKDIPNIQSIRDKDPKGYSYKTNCINGIETKIELLDKCRIDKKEKKNERDSLANINKICEKSDKKIGDPYELNNDISLDIEFANRILDDEERNNRRFYEQLYLNLVISSNRLKHIIFESQLELITWVFELE